VDFVAGQMATEINGQAFVQQDLHAILAGSDSFASSSARKAFSLDTAGNRCKNSPSAGMSEAYIEAVVEQAVRETRQEQRQR